MIKINYRSLSTPPRIGKFCERRYQLTAARRNDAIVKFDRKLETARYFERECNKAKQFNAWNVDNTKESKHLAFSRQKKSLSERRSRLKDLLEKEEKSYIEESQRITSRNVSRVHNNSRSSLSEKRAEDSLYRPLNCRRLQSYFCGNYVTNQEQDRKVFKDFNGRNPSRNYSRLSMESTNLRPEHGNSSEHFGETNKEHTLRIDANDVNQRGYNERMDAYLENSRSARASHLYSSDVDSNDKKRTVASAKPENKLSAGLESCSHVPRTRRLHDSHFLIGNQTYLDEEGGDHMPPNQKFQDRYANRSLEGTNVGETAGHSIEEGSEIEFVTGEENNEDNRIEEENGRNGEDQTDRAYTKEREEIEHTENEKRKEEDEEEEIRHYSSSLDDNASSSSPQENKEHQEELKQLEADEINEQRDIDREVTAKASAGRSDHRHFETEKSLPWMRMIPGDKNLSEQMFLYLTHNELKSQIQDLEKRENQAASKHQWDEALRLRDMRNRLDLARERNLYRRDDLLLDPEVKKLGMAAIEAREKLLKEREHLCTNSSMYSEEAKLMWSQWLIEDRGSVLMNAQHQREDLMKQLEENWRSLAIEDKQRITDSFQNQEIVHGEFRNHTDNSCAFKTSNR